MMSHVVWIPETVGEELNQIPTPGEAEAIPACGRNRSLTVAAQ